MEGVVGDGGAVEGVGPAPAAAESADNGAHSVIPLTRTMEYGHVARGAYEPRQKVEEEDEEEGSKTEEGVVENCSTTPPGSVPGGG